MKNKLNVMIKKLLFTFAIFLTTVSFVQAQQDINVQGNGVSIADADTTPDLADHTDFGQVAVGSSVTRTFTIQNVGNAPLGLSSISKSFSTSGQFTVDNSSVSTPIAGGSFTTFTVTYTPTVAGVSTGEIAIGNDSAAPEDIYTFSIQAEGTSGVQPDINVQGNGISIADADTTPDLADHTNFGQVAVGSSVTHTFTIQNTGTAPLDLTGIAKSFSTSNQFTVDNSTVSTPVAVGASTTFAITYTPTVAGISTGSISISSNSPAPEDTYTFSIQAEGIAAGVDPDINIQGNSTDIVNGDTTPSTADHTDFGQVAIGSPLTRTFTVQNTGGTDLNLTTISLSFGTDSQFTLDNSSVSSPVVSGGSTTFTVTFTPTATGVVTGQIRITSDDPDSESTYIFDIQAEGTNAAVVGALLITQYYHGSNNDQWIEVKNISSTAIISGEYNLALYSNLNTRIGYISTNTPDASVPIGAMAAGAVRLFKNTGASLPSAANLGGAPVTATGACAFTGDDVILISTSVGADCYSKRIDIMGDIPADNETPRVWGQNISYVKGCGTNEVPSLDFNIATLPDLNILTAGDYRRVSLQEVDTANPNTNIALGTQVLGKTTWTTSWDNLVPDRTRDVEIAGTYNASSGSMTVCNLVVTGTLTMDAGTTNYVDVNRDLTVSGSFIIGDTESLIFGVDNNNEGAVITGVVTKKETTTSLANINDFTYWASPVQGASISSVFAANDPARIFEWNQAAQNTIPGGGTETTGEWEPASGTMAKARGYITEGPTAGAYPTQQTVSFTGKPWNGVQIISAGFINDGNDENDYNLVGNLYPSAIDADKFIVENNTLFGTLWFWTHNTALDNSQPVDDKYTTADYAAYNLSGGTAATSGGAAPTKNIGSAQGFMIRAKELGAGAVFKNNMRLKDQNNQFFRGSDSKKSTTKEKDRIWLDMKSNQGAFNQILVGFFDKATDGFDSGYDGIKNSEGYLSLYSNVAHLNGYLKCGIQGLSSFNVDKKVALGFDTFINEAQTYTIGISKIEGALTENDVYLVDNELNITHDLKLADYEFTMDKEGEYPNRFNLQFVKSALGVEDFKLNNDFVVLNEDNALRIKSSTAISSIQVFDVMGRLLIDSKPNQSEFVIDNANIKKGTVLILNATFENGSKVSKKAIKY